jgi:hypothetical protein
MDSAPSIPDTRLSFMSIRFRSVVDRAASARRQWRKMLANPWFYSGFEVALHRHERSIQSHIFVLIALGQ